VKKKKKKNGTKKLYVYFMKRARDDAQGLLGTTAVCVQEDCTMGVHTSEMNACRAIFLERRYSDIFRLIP